MIWAWLANSWLGRVIGGAALSASLFLAIIAWQRKDAHDDARLDAIEKDRDNADDIRDRVRDVPERLHKYSDRGFRD